ncbi:MAG: sensor histidine kinase [Spirulinaceae cyanobacterium]
MKQPTERGWFQLRTVLLNLQGQVLCAGLILIGLSLTGMALLDGGVTGQLGWQVLVMMGLGIVGLGLVVGSAIAIYLGNRQQRQQQYHLQQCLDLLTELAPITPPPATHRASWADLYGGLQQLQTQQWQQQEQSQTTALTSQIRSLQSDRLQQIQAEKMASLNQMAAGLAHEINNPVNFISGNLPLAQTYIQDLLLLIVLYQQELPHPSPRVTDHISEIDLDFVQSDLPKLLSSLRSGAQRIHGIVESLRTFARLDESQLKAVDLHSGLESTLIFLQHRFRIAESERPWITVVKDYADLPLVECYASQLNQVLLNLLTNAIDAIATRRTQAGLDYQPQLTIQTRQSDPETVEIRITDNGVGIPETVRDRLFDPFFTTKPVGQGTGLGLAISYQVIVEQHGGTITCDSTMGVGTEFCLRIPLQQSLGVRSKG